MPKVITESIRKWFSPDNPSEAHVVLYATWISVWGRWFVWLVVVFLIACRPSF